MHTCLVRIQTNLDPSGMLDAHSQGGSLMQQQQQQMQPQPPYRSVSQMQQNMPMSPTGMMPAAMNQNPYGSLGVQDGDMMNAQGMITSNNAILTGPSAG
ncbi:unnamed protein product [Echinostoma caproni]|uniref:Mediator complex subunit 29 n=1 Tax=Echinostoma caproni TaxID=27848 RepID=A0A183A2G5_9TREM|nr:unnamed protein product [Echinostoma caproni]